MFFPRPHLKPILIGSFSCNLDNHAVTEVWVSCGKAGKQSCLNFTLRFVFSLSLVFVVFVQVQTTSVVVQKSYCSSKHELGKNFAIIPVPICRSNTFCLNRNWVSRGILLPSFCAHVILTGERENQLDILMQVFKTDRWWHLAKDVHRFYVFAIVCCVSACSLHKWWKIHVWCDWNYRQNSQLKGDFWHKLRRLAEKLRVLCVDSGCRMLWIRGQTQSIFRLRKQCLPNTHQIMRQRSKQHSITGIATVNQLVSIVSLPNCAWGGNLVFHPYAQCQVNSGTRCEHAECHGQLLTWKCCPGNLGYFERFMRWIFVS